jgi:hypothetical protein
MIAPGEEIERQILLLIDEDEMSHDYCRGGDGTDYIDFNAIRCAAKMAREAVERIHNESFLRRQTDRP